MSRFHRIDIPLPKSHRVSSLCWDGDDLVDWIAGGTRYRLDGSSSPQAATWAHPFDRAVATADGRFQVICEAHGTTGLVLERGVTLRELDRVSCHAEVYEYPVAVFVTPAGRHLLIHCPDAYNLLHIEDLATGERLTTRPGEGQDFFHSRLQVSPDGQVLLSAGWVWHPADVVLLYSIAEALRDPPSLDGPGISLAGTGADADMLEVRAGAFIGAGLLALSVNPLYEYGDTRLFVIDRGTMKTLATHVLDAPTGAMMAVGTEEILCFSGNPRLIDLRTGRVTQRWSDLPCGARISSIDAYNTPLPALALDPGGRRFALAGPEAVTVIALPEDPRP